MVRVNCPRYPGSKRKFYKWENEIEKKCKKNGYGIIHSAHKLFWTLRLSKNNVYVGKKHEKNVKKKHESRDKKKYTWEKKLWCP